MDKEDYRIMLNRGKGIILLQRKKFLQLQPNLLSMAETLREDGQMDNYQLQFSNNWQPRQIRKVNRLDRFHKEIEE
jgi:hypothetical protein